MKISQRINFTRVVSFLSILFITAPAICQKHADVYISGKTDPVVYSNIHRITFDNDSIILLDVNDNINVIHLDDADSLNSPPLYIQKQKILIGREMSEAFIQPLILGKISLYTSFRNGEAVFYLEKDNSGIYIIPTDHFLNYISLLFSDCQQLNMDQLNGKHGKFTYTQNSWLQLVAFYNEKMKEGNTPVEYYRKPPVSYDKSFLAGISMNTTTMNSYPYNRHDLGGGLTPEAGLMFGILYRQRFGFSTGMIYSRLSSHSEFTAVGYRFNDAFELVPVNVSTNLQYSMNIIKLPFLVKIVPWHSDDMSCYLSGGGLINLLLQNRSRVTADDDLMAGIDYTYDMQAEFFTPGWYGCAGFSFPALSQHWYVQFSMNSDMYGIDPITSYSFSDMNSKVTFTSYSFEAGISF